MITKLIPKTKVDLTSHGHGEKTNCLNEAVCQTHLVKHHDGILCADQLNTFTKAKGGDYFIKSCKVNPLVAEIDSFIFGGFSSRFQLYRNHMQSRFITEMD